MTKTNMNPVCPNARCTGLVCAKCRAQLHSFYAHRVCLDHEMVACISCRNNFDIRQIVGGRILEAVKSEEQEQNYDGGDTRGAFCIAILYMICIAMSFLTMLVSVEGFALWLSFSIYTTVCGCVVYKYVYKTAGDGVRIGVDVDDPGGEGEEAV
jgi:hypothetical protein